MSLKLVLLKREYDFKISEVQKTVDIIHHWTRCSCTDQSSGPCSHVPKLVGTTLLCPSERALLSCPQVSGPYSHVSK